MKSQGFAAIAFSAFAAFSTQAEAESFSPELTPVAGIWEGDLFCGQEKLGFQVLFDRSSQPNLTPQGDFDIVVKVSRVSGGKVRATTVSGNAVFDPATQSLVANGDKILTKGTSGFSGL